jgi:hypothetical protein
MESCSVLCCVVSMTSGLGPAPAHQERSLWPAPSAQRPCACRNTALHSALWNACSSARRMAGLHSSRGQPRSLHRPTSQCTAVCFVPQLKASELCAMSTCRTPQRSTTQSQHSSAALPCMQDRPVQHDASTNCLHRAVGRLLTCWEHLVALHHIRFVTMPVSARAAPVLCNPDRCGFNQVPIVVQDTG